MGARKFLFARREVDADESILECQRHYRGAVGNNLTHETASLGFPLLQNGPYVSCSELNWRGSASCEGTQF